MSDRTALPIVSPPDCQQSLGSTTIAGIVLAAGTSSRFGDENKLLAEINGKTVLVQSIQNLIESKVDIVYVVTGNEHHRVQDAIGHLDVQTITNEAYGQGQATSIRTGVRAVRQHTSIDAVLISLGDMPFITSSTINHLIATYQSDAAGIIVAGYQGRRGNPVLFDTSYLESLASVSGDTGARHFILESNDAVLVETEDPGVIQDINTSDDLK
ncbi:nucleotidyltransferase family protein [Natronococcus sp. JC468]|uniref:nucleotidyltransferase family protein n=1 Tax=Natronococcus sp. JC468 TaxID=1961921 RepID=UPI001439DC4E|nr:nucleotidyltransferase family protein [Natronococcus sp. JC468]NKE36117.1 nucleotidyltransferase family protein [Natronococcus sp. JC468]